MIFPVKMSHSTLEQQHTLLIHQASCYLCLNNYSDLEVALDFLFTQTQHTDHGL